jgi:hypothetical protein
MILNLVPRLLTFSYMAQMTRRERLKAIFQGRVPDRPAVKAWGVSSKQDACVHPAFAPVRDLAVERTDLMRHVGAPFNLRQWGWTCSIPSSRPRWAT